jgi:hypothetical protein
METPETADDLFDRVVRAREIATFWAESGSRFQALAALEQYLDLRDRLVLLRARTALVAVDNHGSGA